MTFRNQYWFLSNMYPCRLVIGGIEYTCSEAAFQAAKIKENANRRVFCGLDGFEAKKMGRKIQLRSDWNNVRLVAMEYIVRQKFLQHPELIPMLVSIKGEICEDNTWNDKFWGKCNGVGENHLGKILMKIRDEFTK